MITKTGSILGTIGKHFKSVSGLGYNLGRAANATMSGIGSVATGTYQNVVAPPLRVAARLASKAARKAPWTTAGVLGVSAVAAAKARDRVQRNMIHTDPSDNYTRQSLTGLEYRSPIDAAEADQRYQQNLFY